MNAQRVLELGVVVHPLDRARSTSCPPTSWKASSNDLHHRPGEEDGEVAERRQDQPVRQTLPTPPQQRSRRGLLGYRRRHESSEVLAPTWQVPVLGGSGFQHGAPAALSTSCSFCALVVEDLVDVLLVDDDPRERVGEDAVVVAALRAEADRAAATASASFDRCCVLTAAAIASRPGPTCFESRRRDDREEARDLRQPSPAARRRRGTRSAASRRRRSAPSSGSRGPRAPAGTRGPSARRAPGRRRSRSGGRAAPS